MPEQFNPMHSAKRLNPLLAEQLNVLGRLVRSGVNDLWQDGLLVGQIPPKDKGEELQTLQRLEPVYAWLAVNTPLEGNRIRAQKALRRQVELEQELFGERQATTA